MRPPSVSRIWLPVLGDPGIALLGVGDEGPLELGRGNSARRGPNRKLPGLLVLCLVLGVVLSSIAGTAAQTESEVDFYAPVAPAVRDDIRAATEGELSIYRIDVTLDPGSSTIGGNVRIDYVNGTDVTLDEIALRLYPNAAYYGEGGLTVSSARVGGRMARPVLASFDTAMLLPLRAPLPPGSRIDIEIDFETVIPTDSTGSYGILNHETSLGSWVLTDWYPIVTGWEADRGWRIDPPTYHGDPTFSEAALYDVTIQAPSSLTLVGTGTAVVDRLAGGNWRWSFNGGPAREFTLVADEDLVTLSETAGETTVHVHVNAGSPAEAVAAFVLEAAVRALNAYEGRYGPYPYTELDLIETELAGTIGVSWSGVIFLDSDQLLASQAALAGDYFGLDFAIVHEVGHQWWGNLVGVNSNDHTFMNEGLTNAATYLNFLDAQGPEVAREHLSRQMAGPYLAMLGEAGDAVVDLPVTDDYPGAWGVALHYGKAALGFLAIREEIGDAAFTTALDRYVADYGFGIAEPADLRGLFQAAGGKPIGDLWTYWFADAATSSNDVVALVDSIDR